uniref:Saccharopine dehydrogenase NADP binding domain-containing protein n=1 Tax=Oryza rufipogon TaxID=4529 RepID=A0A0E0R402_ORYRU
MSPERSGASKEPMATVVRACMPLPPAAVASSSAAPSTDAQAQRRSSSSSARVLVLGGTGRVGGSTATALSKLRPDLNILIAGRNLEKGESLASKLGDESEFVQVDIRDRNMLEEVLQDVDLVVHAAGPFQRENECTVLQAAIATKTIRGEQRVSMNKQKIAVSQLLQLPASILENLPEVKSAYKVLGVPTVSARFGTAPFFWNWVMQAFANFLPVEFLRDKNKVLKLVGFVDPFVRAIDGIAGERVSMRVDLDCSNGKNTIGLFSHRKLSVSVGYATAAFVLAVLEGSTQPGVWFPEEPEGVAIESRKVLLERASQGTTIFVMNKPSWMIETDPKEVGLGIYV